MKLKDIVAFAALSLIWGSSFFWIKIALIEIGPLLLVAFRILFGLIMLVIYASIVRPDWPKDKRVWINLFILGIINTGLPFALISWGEQTVDSGVASIINATVPLFTALIAHLTLKDDRLSVIRAAGMIVGFGGVIVVISRSAGVQVDSNLLGQGAILLAAVSYGSAAVFARSKAKGISPLVQSLGALIAADSVAWVAAGFLESPITLPQLPLTLGALLWLGVMGSFLAYLLYYYLIQSIGPTRSSMVAFVFPVIAMILGSVFLGEVLDWKLVVGGSLVLLSVVIVNGDWDLGRLKILRLAQRSTAIAGD